jgi:hypothetical protein
VARRSFSQPQDGPGPPGAWMNRLAIRITPMRLRRARPMRSMNPGAAPIAGKAADTAIRGEDGATGPLIAMVAEFRYASGLARDVSETGWASAAG